MTRTRSLTAAAIAALTVGAGGAVAVAAPDDAALTPAAQAFTEVDRSTAWSLVDKVESVATLLTAGKAKARCTRRRGHVPSRNTLNPPVCRCCTRSRTVNG